MTISYSLVYLSDIIEIPQLGLSNVTAVNGVPKKSGQVWNYDETNGIDGNCTRLRLNSDGEWEIASSGDAIACAASSATSLATTGNIYMYPMAVLTAPNRGQLVSPLMYTPGFFYIVNSSKLQYELRKVSTESWNVGDSIYYNLNSGLATKVSTAPVIALGLSPQAVEADTTSAYMPISYAYNEGNVSAPTPISQEIDTFPRLPTDTVAFGTSLSVDISGNYFSATSGLRYGDYADTISAENPGSATTLRAFPLTNGKIVTENLQMMFSTLNQTVCLLVPQFGTNTYQTIPNRNYAEVYPKPTVGEEGAASTRSINFSYSYRLRNYVTIPTINKKSSDSLNISQALLFPSNWNPNIAIPVPETTNFVLQPGFEPDISYTPPGPIDNTGKLFVYSGIMNTVSSFYYWQLWRKPQDTQEEVYHTYVDSDVPIQIRNIGGLNRAIIRSQDGTSDVFPNDFYTLNKNTPATIPNWSTEYLMYPLWVTQAGLDEVFDFEICPSDSDGSTNMTYSVYRTDADGVKTVKDWTNMNKVVWFTQDVMKPPPDDDEVDYTITHYKFSVPLSLSDMGETNPRIKLQNYTLKMRLYNSSIDPYMESTHPWGLPIQTNYGVSSYMYDTCTSYPYPFPYTKKKYTLRANNGEDITTESISGAAPPTKRFDVSYTEPGVTFTVADAFAGMKKFQIAYDITPVVTGQDTEYNGCEIESFTFRVRRKSDGKYIHSYKADTATTATGLVWSNIANWAPTNIVSGSAVYGAAPYNSTLIKSATYPWYLVDLHPNLTEDEYEIEVLATWEFFFQNELTPSYRTRRYSHTFSMSK